MISFPNIKINIGLNIVGKRDDGYHNIESIFYPLPLSDVLEMIPSSEETTFIATGIEIPGAIEHNLCLKAFGLLQSDFNLPHLHIHLHKIVPIGAGLGGGSSDAAFVLKMVNEKFALGLSIENLESYARRLGSDCAFFIEDKPKYCFQKGDEFIPIALDISPYFIVVIYPKLHISTAEAYAGVKPKASAYDLKTAIAAPIDTWKHTIRNDFEDSIFPKYPTLGAIKDMLYEMGALYSSMTGSGSSLFGIFKKKMDTSHLEKNYWVWTSD
ncbi:MAG TPA: 4-(cytidine 5'-diphospho)-2-C-methyl-D-erythritol kinase [Cytophagales bacterium]|nr:4-(cytidine 5'-diphospho)-2-C-methyl-D-erythritol kinase [Cytophagales bacterium]